MTFDVNWRGPQVLNRVEKATADAIDEVMSDCVNDAKSDVPVATASLQGSIKIVDPGGKDAGGVIAGVWGSTDINYALAIETGNFAYLRGQKSSAKLSVPTRRNRGRRGSLRRAADQNYPNLQPAIRRRIR